LISLEPFLTISSGNVIKLVRCPKADIDRLIGFVSYARGFVAQISIIWDSRHESSVIAGVYEQLATYDVQDLELGRV
jgi:hypothetical protein